MSVCQVMSVAETKGMPRIKFVTCDSEREVVVMVATLTDG